MVYGFVHQSGGAISVDSQPGVGSVFIMILPRGDGAPHRAAPARPVVANLRGSGTILIVEDERPIRRLAATALGKAGYHTFEAVDGQEALEIFDKHGDTIVMVVTDVVMPRMGGPELAERLRGRRPGLPLLYMTGYAEEGDALRQKAAGAPVLLKPFSPEKLLRTIAGMLRKES